MDSWLKQVEADQNKHSVSKERAHRHIQERRLRIESNYANIKEEYGTLVQLFKNMTLRVNSLPIETRQDFGKIRYSFKQTDLNNQLHIFSTSRKVSLRKLTWLLPFIRKIRAKHIRVLFLTVSREPGMVELELKESLLQKRDIKKDESSSESRRRETRKRINLLYTMPISEVTETIAYELLDWLSFHQELQGIELNPSYMRDISNKRRRRRH